MPSGPWQGEHKRSGSGPASRPHSAVPASMSKRPASAASSRPFSASSRMSQSRPPSALSGKDTLAARSRPASGLSSLPSRPHSALSAVGSLHEDEDYEQVYGATQLGHVAGPGMFVLGQMVSLMQSINSWPISLNPETVRQTVCSKACSILMADRANFFLNDSENQRLVLHHTPLKGEARTFSVPYGQGLVGTVGRDGGTINCADVDLDDRHDEDNDQLPEEAPRARTMLCMELKDCNGMPYAVIQVFNKRSPPVGGKLMMSNSSSFTEQDEAMLALLSLQAASVLRCCDLHLRNCLSKGYVDPLRKYDRVEIDRLVKACEDEVLVGPWESEDKLLLAVAAHIKKSVDAQHCTLFLKQEDGQLGTPLLGKGGKFECVKVQVSDDTTAGWCAGHGEFVNVKNLALDERFNSGMSDEGEREAAMECSIMCVPMFKSIDDAGCGTGVVGVIEVIRTGGERSQMGAFESEYLTDLSRHLLAALSKARENEMHLHAQECTSQLSKEQDIEGGLAVVKDVLSKCLGRKVTTRSFMVDHDRGELVTTAAIDMDEGAGASIRQVELRGPVSQLSIEGYVARVGQTVRLEDARAPVLSDQSSMDKTLDPHTGLTGRPDVVMPIMCLPVRDQRGIVKVVLQIIADGDAEDESGGVSRFTDRQLQVAEMVAGKLEDMLTTFSAVRSARSHEGDMGLLVTSLPELFAEFDLHRLCRLMAAQTCKLLGATHCTPYVVDQATGELWTLIEGYSREVRLPKGMGMVGATAVTGRAAYVPDCSEPKQGLDTIISEAGASAGVRSMLISPVLSGTGVVLAVIQAFHPKPDAFDEHKRRLQTTYNRLVGVAFDNQALASRRVRDIQRGISVEWSPERVHCAVRETVSNLLGCEVSAVFQLDASATGFFSYHNDGAVSHAPGSGTSPQTSSHAQSKEAGKGARYRCFPLGKGVVGRVFGSGDSILTEAAQFLPFFDAEVDSAGCRDVKGLLCVPMADSAGRRVGVMLAANKKKGRFSRDDEAMLKLLAAQWGEAISNNTKYEHAQATIRCNDYMLRAMRSLTTVTEPRRLLDSLSEQVMGHITSSHKCTVFLLDHDNRDLVTFSESGDQVRVPISRSTVAGLAAESGQMVRVKDVYADPRFSKYASGASVRGGGGPASMLSCPVRISGQVAAVVQILKTGDDEGFSPRDEDDLQSLADNVAGGSLEVFETNRMAHRLVQAIAKATALSSDLGMRVGGLPSNIKRAVRQLLGCERVNVFLIDVIEQELVKDLAVDFDDDIEMLEERERELGAAIESLRGGKGSNDREEVQVGEQVGEQDEGDQVSGLENKLFVTLDALAAARAQQARAKGVTLRIKVGQGLAGRVAQAGGTINTHDASGEKLEKFESYGVQGSEVATALTTCAYTACGQMVAVVQAINKKQGVFTSEDEAVMDKLSVQSAMMLQHAQQMQQLDKRALSRSHLGEFLVKALPCEKVNSLVHMVNTEPSVAIMVAARQVVLYVYDETAKTLATVNKYGESLVSALDDLATSVAGQAAVSGEVVEQTFSTQGEADDVESGEQDVNSEHQMSTRHANTVRSCRIGQPVLSRRKEGILLGVIECVNKKGGIFEDEDREALVLLASVVGGLIEALLSEENLKSELGALGKAGSEGSPRKQAGARSGTRSGDR